MAEDTLVAVDLAKSALEVAVSNHPGRVAKQKRYSRRQFPLAVRPYGSRNKTDRTDTKGEHQLAALAVQTPVVAQL